MRGRCYICFIRDKEAGKVIKHTSFVTKKLGIFLQDFLTFIPRAEHMKNAEKNVARGNTTFTITEMSLFNKIIEQLQP
jgi:hypothetical protein